MNPDKYPRELQPYINKARAANCVYCREPNEWNWDTVRFAERELAYKLRQYNATAAVKLPYPGKE